MSASIKPSSMAPSGTPLYDVINEHGEMLAMGVTHTWACLAMDERQAFPAMHPGGQGDMCIRSQRLRATSAGKGGLNNA